MNIYISGDMSSFFNRKKGNNEPDSMFRYISHYFGSLIPSKQKKAQITLRDLVQSYQRWIKDTCENIYYVYDPEKNKYLNQYHKLNDILSDIKLYQKRDKKAKKKNSPRFKFVNDLDQVELPQEIKRQAYFNIYRDMEYDLKFFGFQLSSLKSIEELKKEKDLNIEEIPLILEKSTKQ